MKKTMKNCVRKFKKKRFLQFLTVLFKARIKFIIGAYSRYVKKEDKWKKKKIR